MPCRLFASIIVLACMLSVVAPMAAMANLKGTLTCLDEKYMHLSPYKGMVAQKTGYIRYLWHYGNQNDATIKLIKVLFQEVNCDGQFLPSQQSGVPGLDQKLIGQLIALIANDELKGFHNNKEKYNIFINTWFKNARACYNAGIVRSKSSMDDIKNYFEVLQKLILESLAECKENDENALYAPHTTETIVLTLLYLKGHNKDKQFFCDYLSEIQLFLKENVSIDDKFMEDSYGLEHYKKFLVELKELSEEQRIIFMANNLELALDTLVYLKYYTSKVPPQPLQSNFNYAGQKAIRPDCFEGSFFDIFVSNLLYNSKKGIYDTGLLPQHLKLNSGLVALIKDGLSPFTLNDKKIRQAWYDLVSGHNEIEYKQKTDNPYEIKSTIKNVLALLNILYSLDAKNFDEVSQKLSTNDRKITFTLQKKDYESDETANTKNTITMHINDKHCGISYDAEFEVRPGHTKVFIPERNRSSLALLSDTKALCAELLDTQHQSYGPYLLPLFVDQTMLTLKTDMLTFSDAMLLYFSSSMQDPNIRTEVCIKLLECYKKNLKNKDFKKIESFKEWIQTMLEDLAVQDFYYHCQLSRKIMSLGLYDFSDNSDCFAQYILRSGVVLDALVNKGNVEFKEIKYLVNKMGKSIKSDQDLLNLNNDLYFQFTVISLLKDGGSSIQYYLIEQSPLKTTVKDILFKDKYGENNLSKNTTTNNPWILLLDILIRYKKSNEVKFCLEQISKQIDEKDMGIFSSQLNQIIYYRILDVPYLIEESPECIRNEMVNHLAFIIKNTWLPNDLLGMVTYLCEQSPESIRKKMVLHVEQILNKIAGYEHFSDVITYLTTKAPEVIKEKVMKLKLDSGK